MLVQHSCPVSRIDPNSRRYGQPSAAWIPRYRHTCCYETRNRPGRRHPELSAGGRGYAGLRRYRCGAHPCCVPNRHVGRGGGPVAAPVRSCRRSVLRAVWFSAVARTRGGRPRIAAPACHRSLSSVPTGSHHAGLPGGRGGDPDPAAGGQPREPDGLAGQPDADPGVCAANPDSRTDPDVESVGGGQFLSGATNSGFSGIPASDPLPGTGDPCGGVGQLWVGSATHPHRHGGELPQLAAGLCVLVRGRDVARGIDGQPHWLAASTGPQPTSDRLGGSGGIPDLCIALGRTQGSGSCHARSVRGANLHGGHRRRRTSGPTGA